MKKALVVKKEFGGRSVGKVEVVGEAADIDSRKGTPYNKMVKVVVPVELEDVPIINLKGVLVPLQAEKWTKEGEADKSTLPDPVDDWTHVPAVPEHWEIQRGADFEDYDKKNRINSNKKTMQDNVEAQAAELFGTKDKIASIADYLTLLSMQSSPDKFKSGGLIVLNDVVGFSIGDELNTKAKVTNYAKTMLDLADDYALYRAQQKQAYALKKKSIEDE